MFPQRIENVPAKPGRRYLGILHNIRSSSIVRLHLHGKSSVCLLPHGFHSELFIPAGRNGDRWISETPTGYNLKSCLEFFASCNERVREETREIRLILVVSNKMLPHLRHRDIWVVNVLADWFLVSHSLRPCKGFDRRITTVSVKDNVDSGSILSEVSVNYLYKDIRVISKRVTSTGLSKSLDKCVRQ